MNTRGYGGDQARGFPPRRFEERRGTRPRDDMGQREMHNAVCSECGNECQVPFKPTEGKPVYCRDCFAKHRPPRRF